jgi:hypothetical protein
LVKINKLKALSTTELYSDDWSKMTKYPIWGKKEKIIKLQYRYSLIRFLKKQFKVLKKKCK